jgi:hypothetical protein
MSVKDRWVGPHEHVLNVPIACRRYGPDKSSSRLSTEAWPFPTTSLAIMGEKLGTDLQTGQPVCCGLGRVPFFLGAVDLFKSIDDYVKCCYTLTVFDTYGLGPYGDLPWHACGVLVWFFLQDVHRFESP